MSTRKLHAAARLGTLMVAVMLSLACSTVSRLLPGGSGTDQVAAAEAAYAGGDYDSAIADYTAALGADPNAAATYLARGEVYYLVGRYDEAIADFTSALDRGYEPKAEALSARGDARIANGDFDLYGDDVAAAASADPNFGATYYPVRQAAYSQAITQHPDLASAYFARAWATIAQADTNTDAILADLTAAIDHGQTPEIPARLIRSQAYVAAQDYDGAVDDLTWVIDSVPDFVPAYETRARSYIALGRYDEAMADLQTTVSLAPNYGNGHNGLCWYGSILGHAAEVLESCELAVQLAPTPGALAAYRDSRGLARALTGDFAGAIEDFQVYVDYAEANGLPKSNRDVWIASLAAGFNPFDEATLKALLEQ